MSLKQKIFSNIFWRNAIADFGGRTVSTKITGNFVPYFQYKIGPYQFDEFLYFQKEPFALRYKNEIFNKLFEYSGNDIVRYLDFHYSAYPDKQDFLRFLKYEITDRLHLSSPKSRLRKLESALDWVSEKKQDLQKIQEEQLRGEIKEGVQTIIQNQPTASPQEVDSQIKAFSDKLSDRFESLITETEKGIMDITGSFVKGNIELNNHNHEEKLIQLMILLQQVQAPPQLKKVEQLFKKFSATDIASILHLHFNAFKDEKLNTVQRKVGSQGERIKSTNNSVKKLTEALQEFFYQ
jgi:hypothetical protein